MFTKTFQYVLTEAIPPHPIPLLSLLAFRNLTTLLPFNMACNAFVSIFVYLFFVISGPSSSQKKTLFHKIVSKYKQKKEKPNTVDKGELEHHVMCVDCNPVVNVLGMVFTHSWR